MQIVSYDRTYQQTIERPVVQSDKSEPLSYKLLVGRDRKFEGKDTQEFSKLVSRALDDGYVLHGTTSYRYEDTGHYVMAQAVVLPKS